MGEWARNSYGEIGYFGFKRARWAGGGRGMVNTPSNALMTGWTCTVRHNIDGSVTFLSWDHDDAQSRPKKVSVQVGWTYTGNRARWGQKPNGGPLDQQFNFVGMDQPEIFCDPDQPFTKQTSQSMVANEKNFTLIKAGSICSFPAEAGNNNIAQTGLYRFYRKGTFDNNDILKGCTLEVWQAKSNGAGGVNWVQSS